jgi:hypothetical protein
MIARTECLARAIAAYERFYALQQRIATIEARALAKHQGNSGMTSYKLGTAPEYWLYRDLCKDRDIEMSVAMLNASMTAIIQESKDVTM